MTPNRAKRVRVNASKRPQREPPPTLRLDETAGPHPAVLRLCDVIRRIPRGRVCTYGQLASAIGWPKHARLVGRFLSESPLATTLPWHRVVGAGGTISLRDGGGPEIQQKRLRAEGVRITPAGRINLGEYGWAP